MTTQPPVLVSASAKDISPGESPVPKPGPLTSGDMPEGPWVSSTTATSGSGASVSLVQEKVGEWLGILSLVNVSSKSVLSEEECVLITVAMEHKTLLDNYPITTPELVRLAHAPSDEERVCTCPVHAEDCKIEESLFELLKNIMACTSELNGRFLSGNLTNLTVYLLTFIIRTKAGLTNIQIQPEAKSDVGAAGSKVVFSFGCGEQYLTVESTPDFYIRNQAPLVYLVIGEVESVGSKDPEIQLAIGCLGMLTTRKTTQIGAVLIQRDLKGFVYLGTCRWREGYGSVSFKRVNRASGFKLDEAGGVDLFSRTIIAVAIQVSESRPFSPPTQE